MTRKDYKIIAESIRKSIEHFNDDYRYNENMQDHLAVATAVIVRHLQEGLKRDNPNFKPDVFYKACSLLGKEVY